MGGGKKKLSISQLEKAQTREEAKGKSGKRGSATPSAQKKMLGVVPLDARDKSVARELLKMKVLTPYTVASRFNIRLSAAKDLLEELHHQGVITYVSGGRNTRIYRNVEQA